MRIMKTILVLLMLSLVAPVFAQGSVYTEDKTAISVTPAHPEFVIKLKSNPTTGYSWFLRAFDGTMIDPVKHNYQAATDKKLMGASGFEYWSFRVKPEAFKVPQQLQLRFVYSRPWENSDQEKVVIFVISTTSAPSTSHVQKPALQAG